MSIEIVLPFPPPELNPNHCSHWSKKAKIKADMRTIGWGLSLKHGNAFTKKDTLHLSMVFYPPRRRKLDLDNALASMKSLIDGMADGIRINDRQIKRITIEYADFDGDPRVVAIWEVING